MTAINNSIFSNISSMQANPFPIGEKVTEILYETGEVVSYPVEKKEGFPRSYWPSSIMNSFRKLKLPAHPLVAVAIDEWLTWGDGVILSSLFERGNSMYWGQLVIVYETLEARIYQTIEYRKEIFDTYCVEKVIVRIGVKHPDCPHWEHVECFTSR